MQGSFFADDNPLAARGPRTDARFRAWQNIFVTYVNAHPPDLGLAAGDVVDLNNSAAAWTTDYPAPFAAQTAAECHAFTGGARVGMSFAMSTCLPATSSRESMAPGHSRMSPFHSATG